MKNNLIQELNSSSDIDNYISASLRDMTLSLSDKSNEKYDVFYLIFSAFAGLLSAYILISFIKIM